MAITLQPFITQSFSKLHRVPHVILHQVVYIFDYVIVKMADHSLQRIEVFLKNRHFSFIGPYRLTSIQQGKSFICNCRLFHTYSKKVHGMRA